jgi:general secretion pathway protein F
MAVFGYKATSPGGEVVEGAIEAPDEKGVIEKLKDSGLIPLRVMLPKERAIGLRRRLIPGYSSSDVLAFITELSVLLNAGLPLDRSLSILSNITGSSVMKEVIPALLRSVREGNSLSDALERHPKVFKRLHVNMVRAGESGGVLNSVLERLVEFMESSKNLRDHVLSALIYPVILICTAGASIIILLTYVIPKFKVIFEDFGQSLPLSTRIVLSVSGFLSGYWWLLILIAAGGGFYFRHIISKPDGRMKWDRFKLRAAGEIIKKLETARFSRTLGTLLRSGVPLLSALGNVRETAGNVIVSSSIDAIARGAKEGKGVAGPMAATGVFPELAVSMIRVGEETGQLDSMLLKVADTYEKGLQVSIKRFMGLLEPLLILAMGIIVGFIVLSMLIAIFSVNELPF